MSLTNSFLFGGIMVLIMQFSSETNESHMFGILLLLFFVMYDYRYNAVLKVVKHHDMPFKMVYKICYVCFLITHLLGAIATIIFENNFFYFYMIALLLPLLLVNFLLKRGNKIRAADDCMCVRSALKLSLIVVGFIFLKIIAINF